MKKRIKTVAVFCGSCIGTNDVYARAAEQLADELLKAGIHIIYGGADIGLMGVVANRMLAGGGQVTGVIPSFMADEIRHVQLTELVLTETMHERKEIMRQRADAFIALPGGIGTWEELLEAATLTQLGLQQKPCAFLNINDYYTPMMDMFNQAVLAGFVKAAHRDMILVSPSPETLVAELLKYKVAYVDKWD